MIPITTLPTFQKSKNNLPVNNLTHLFNIIIHFAVAQQMSLNELSKRYKEMSMQIFRQSPFQGTKNLVWSHSYYDTSVWETILKENFGEHSLISTARKAVCPKVSVSPL